MKIGIAGNGKIVGEMIGAATTVEGIVIEAICAREKSRAKAEKIADEYGIAKVYTDYSKMLADSDIDFQDAQALQLLQDRFSVFL